MSRFAVLDDDEIDAGDETNMEIVPPHQQVATHQQMHIGFDVIIAAKEKQWNTTFHGSPPHGMISKMISCGMIRFEGSNIEKECSFALYTNDNASNKRIKMMANLKHPNLLNGIVFALEDTRHQIYHGLALVFISGTMEEFVKNHFNVFFSDNTHVLSDRFLKFLRAMIDAISVVHYKGFYHGDVQKKNMLYREANNEYFFFLGNYVGSDEKNVQRKQVSDWRGLGWSIESILGDYITKRKVQNHPLGKGKMKVKIGNDNGAYEDYTCVALQDLINILKGANAKILINIKYFALKSMPFQKVYERQRYMTVIVPAFLKCNTYRQTLESHLKKYVKMPWTSSTCTLYLDDMMDYRKRIHGREMPYDEYSGIAFIKYVCGVYEHYHEFRSWKDGTLSTVDGYFRMECPTLFKALKDIEVKVYPDGPPVL